MTLKKYSDHARAFTFKRDFETMDHANVTSTDILSYMVGTYWKGNTFLYKIVCEWYNSSIKNVDVFLYCG